jgi:phage terminase Nu1 subunit (DNA packaging protein)
MVTKSESLCNMDVSTSDLAEILGLTDRRIRQLAKKEILLQPKRGKFNLSNAVQEYIKFLRTGEGTLRGNPEVAKDASYNDERTKLTRIQREQAELKLAVARGELHKAKDVKQIVGGMIMVTRSRLLDLPNKVAPNIVGKKDLDDIKAVLEEEIELALQSLADYDSSVYTSRAIADEKDGEHIAEDN